MYSDGKSDPSNTRVNSMYLEVNVGGGARGRERGRSRKVKPMASLEVYAG